MQAEVIVPAQRLDQNFYSGDALEKWAKEYWGVCIFTVVHCINENISVSWCELRSVSLLPGCTAQIVETNWGGGQSLYVFLKSCASLEVEGEVAVAEASSGLMWAMAASLCLPAGHDAKLSSCSSCLTHFSQDKFLHPSIWLNQQKCVRAWRGPIPSPAAIPADAAAGFGMQITLAVPGLFYIACLSWACILPVLLQTELWQTAFFHLFQVSELWRAGCPQRYANRFLVVALVLRDAAMFSSALQQLMLSSVSARTCTGAGWDFVWELGICSIPEPFPSSPSSQKTRKSHSWACLIFASVHNLHASSQSQFLLQMWSYTAYSSKLHREMLISFCGTSSCNLCCVSFTVSPVNITHVQSKVLHLQVSCVPPKYFFFSVVSLSFFTASPVAPLSSRKPQVNPYGCLPY